MTDARHDTLYIINTLAKYWSLPIFPVKVDRYSWTASVICNVSSPRTEFKIALDQECLDEMIGDVVATCGLILGRYHPHLPKGKTPDEIDDMCDLVCTSRVTLDC